MEVATGGAEVGLCFLIEIEAECFAHLAKLRPGDDNFLGFASFVDDDFFADGLHEGIVTYLDTSEQLGTLISGDFPWHTKR